MAEDTLGDVVAALSSVGYTLDGMSNQLDDIKRSLETVIGLLADLNERQG